MSDMGLLARKKEGRGAAAAAAQLRDAGRHPFVQIDGYVPLSRGETALYRATRESSQLADSVFRPFSARISLTSRITSDS